MSSLRAAVGPCLRLTFYSHNCLGMAENLGVSSPASRCYFSSKVFLGLQPGSGHLGSPQSLRVAARRSDLKGSALLISFRDKVWCSHSYQVTGTGS